MGPAKVSLRKACTFSLNASQPGKEHQLNEQKYIDTLFIVLHGSARPVALLSNTVS